MYYPMFFDPTYLLILIGVMLSLWASAKLRSTYSKYSQMRSYSGITGAEAAEKILHTSGIYDVRVEHIAGNLTDHYDPGSKVLRLSDTVYGSQSVAAIGVAAHECGHAVQHAKGYTPLRFRSALVPIANFGATISWPLILVGILIGGSNSSLLISLGIFAFSFAVLFQLVTLPVEYNASNRAVGILGQSGILGQEELTAAKKVLGAAALTYVAGAATQILQLLRLLILFGGRRRD